MITLDLIIENDENENVSKAKKKELLFFSSYSYSQAMMISLMNDNKRVEHLQKTGRTNPEMNESERMSA